MTTQSQSSSLTQRAVAASSLHLDARKPLFILTLSPGDPELLDELALDCCYLIFNDMQQAEDFAHAHAVHPLTREPMPWRITVLTPTEKQLAGPGYYDGLFNRLFGVCMVHAVLSDPSFKKYYPRAIHPELKHSFSHRWPIVVSLTHMAALCDEISTKAAIALQARDIHGEGDYNVLQPACVATVRMFSDYWRRIRRVNASLTTCQRTSNLITELFNAEEVHKNAEN